MEPTNVIYSVINSPNIQQILYHYSVCADENTTATPQLGSTIQYSRHLMNTASTDSSSVAVSNPLFRYVNSSFFYLEAANASFTSALPAATFYLNTLQLSTQCITEIQDQVKIFYYFNSTFLFILVVVMQFINTYFLHYR